MQTRKEQIEAIWNKMLSNEATPAELDMLMKELEAEGEDPADWHFISEGFARERVEQPGFTAMDADQQQRLWQHWQANKAQQTTKRRIPLWRRWGQVAAAIIILVAGVFIWQKQQKTTSPDTHAIAADIAPGKNGAILTLANGKELILDSAGSGIIAIENDTKIILENGQLDYQAKGNADNITAYNTMYTPRGRQFRLTLPDGTRVWLNSASTLRFPAAFNTKERHVSINGEAYFEVAKNAAAPFRIDVAGKANIEVLGTSFNISAYDNGKLLQTTLMEGSIKLEQNTTANQQKVILKPGQQAVINNTASQTSTTGITVINNVDIDKVVAWKNGLFNFHGLSLKEAMQQLERWYDIEVVYENGIPEIPFDGEISRNVGLEKLLKMLADADLTFKMEKERKLIITK